MRKNTAKWRMLAGEPTIGASAALGSPLSAELLSFAGFDHVVVDNQHGVWDHSSCMEALHGICLGDAVPMARVEQNDFYAIGGMLDRGALGIIVPMVNSPEDARAAARAMRYPPLGERSMGPLGARLHGSDYMQESNNEVLLAVQIETVEAVEHAEEILAVEGVDACWIGPADLAASMGVDRFSPKGSKVHEAAVLSVLDACRKNGKIPGICEVFQPKHFIDKGFLFVTAISDHRYISSGAAETLRALR